MNIVWDDDRIIWDSDRFSWDGAPSRAPIPIMRAPITAFKGLTVGLIEEPALTIKGIEAFTPEKIDPFFRKLGERIQKLTPEQWKKEVEEASAGVMFPTSKRKIGESLQTWGALAGRNLPVMMNVWLGNLIGGAIGALKGGVLGGKIGAFAGGYTPMVLREAEAFMEEARRLGLDENIVEKWARPYGLASGAVEYAQQILMLGPFKRVNKAIVKNLESTMRKTIIKKVLKEVGVGLTEGGEELTQAGLMSRLMRRAIEEQKRINPDWEPATELPKYVTGREFIAGTGIALLTRGLGRGITKITPKKVKVEKEGILPPWREKIEVTLPLEKVTEQVKKETAKPTPPPVEVAKPTPPPVETAKPTPPPVEVPVKKMGIPKELEPLAKEARKYKTAEEFAKAVAKPHFTEIPKNIQAQVLKNELKRNPTETIENLKEVAKGFRVNLDTKTLDTSGLNPRFTSMEEAIDFYNLATKGIKPEVVEKIAKFTVDELKKAKRMTIDMLMENKRRAQKEATRLKEDVLRLGGLEKDEEIEIIPKSLIRKKGLHLSELRENLNSLGWNFDNNDELRFALAEIKELPKLKRADFIEVAENFLREENAETETLRAVIKQLLQPRAIAKERLSRLKEEALQKTKEIIRKRRQAMYERERKKKVIQQIKKRLSTKGLKWGYDKRLQMLKESIGTISKKERRALEDYARFIKNEIAEGVDIGITKDKLIETVAQLGKRSLQEMSMEELMEFNDLVARTIHQGRLKNKLKKIAHAREITTFVDKSVKEIKGTDIPDIPEAIVNMKSKPTDIPHNLQRLWYELKRPERLLIRIGKGTQRWTYKIWEAMKEADGEYLVSKETMLKKIRDYVKNIYSEEDFKREITPERIREGLEVNHAQMKMIMLYALDKISKLELNEGNMITDEDIEIISKKLTKTDQKIIDFALKVGREYYEKINPVYRRLYGVDMPYRRLWFHIFSDRTLEVGADSISEIINNKNFYIQAVPKGFTKRRVGGRRPLILDFWGNFLREIDMMEKFLAYAEVERDVRAIINHPKWRKAVESLKDGNIFYREIQTWFGDTVGYPPAGRQDAISRTTMLLRTRAVTSLIVGNITTAFRMASSLPAGIRHIPPHLAVKYLSEYISHPLKMQAIIFEKSPVQAYRTAGGESAIMSAIEQARQKKAFAYIRGKESLIEKGGKLMFFFDRRTAQAVWWANYRYALKKFSRIAKNAEELERMAIKEADRWVYRTQPAWRTVDLPSLYRSRNELTRMMVILTNFPNQMLNMIVEDSFIAFKQGRISKLQLIADVAVLMTITPLLYGLSRRWRFPTKKEIIADILFGPLGYIPGGRDMQITLELWVTGKPNYYSGMGTPLPFLFLEALARMITAKKWRTKARYAAQLAALTAGIPWAQPERTFKGIKDLMSGKTKDVRRLIVSEYMLKRPEQKDELQWDIDTWD